MSRRSGRAPGGQADVAVVGCGPAGCAALLQLARSGVAFAAFEAGRPGGLLHAARRIDNLPGFPGGIAGPELARRLAATLRDAKIPVSRARVERITATGGGYRLHLADGAVFAARAVIVATGTHPLPLPAPLSAFGGLLRARRDAAGLPRDLAGRRAVVVGGGEAALDTALSLHDRGARVELVVRGDAPRANGRLLADFHAAGIAFHAGRRLVDIARRGRTGRFARLDDGAELPVDLLFACIGRAVALPVLPPAEARSGLFLAGDCLGRPDRYIAPALGDGTRAAEEALRFLYRAGDRVSPGGDIPSGAEL